MNRTGVSEMSVRRCGFVTKTVRGSTGVRLNREVNKL